MKELYIKQKVFSLNEKFNVKNEKEEDVYFVEGSFMKIPKTFSVKGQTNDEVARITKKTFTFLPKFLVEVGGQEIVTIKKEFSFFKARYTMDLPGMEVEGNWLDMEFQVYQHGELIGEVSKEWFSWGDSYKLQILKEDMETLLLALVIAIDCVKADQTATSSAAYSG